MFQYTLPLHFLCKLLLRSNYSLIVLHAFMYNMDHLRIKMKKWLLHYFKPYTTMLEPSPVLLVGFQLDIIYSFRPQKIYLLPTVPHFLTITIFPSLILLLLNSFELHALFFLLPFPSCTYIQRSFQHLPLLVLARARERGGEIQEPATNNYRSRSTIIRQRRLNFFRLHMVVIMVVMMVIMVVHFHVLFFLFWFFLSKWYCSFHLISELVDLALH